MQFTGGLRNIGELAGGAGNLCCPKGSGNGEKVGRDGDKVRRQRSELRHKVNLILDIKNLTTL